jgi:hypothetical protein
MLVAMVVRHLRRRIIVVISQAIGFAHSAATITSHSELSARDAMPQRAIQKLFLAIDHKAVAVGDSEVDAVEMLEVVVGEVVVGAEVDSIRAVQENHLADSKINLSIIQNLRIRR